MEEAKVIDIQENEVKEVKETEAPAKAEEKKESKVADFGKKALSTGKKVGKIALGVGLGIGIYVLGEKSGAAKALKKIAAKAADDTDPATDDTDPSDVADDAE